MPAAKGYTLPFVVVPLAIAALSWLGCQQLSAFDNDLFQRLLAAAQVPEQTGEPARWTAFVEAILVLAASELGFISGFRLGTTGRIIVWIQLFVAFILLQCLFSYFAHIPGHPVGYGLTLAFGMAGGYWLKLLDREKKRHEARYYELLLRNKELDETRLQIVKQDEVERRILAADLHDQVLNDLKAVKQKVAEYAASSLDRESGRDIDALLVQAMTQVREVMDSLCPSVLEHLGLVAAVDDCLRRGGERAGLKVRFKSDIGDGQLERLSMVEQSLLFRIVQESVTNVLKHAGATTLRGSVEVADERLKITIADDGKGMDPDLVSGDSRGLRYMRQRADLIGATISWRANEADKGTVVEIGVDLAGRGSGSSSDH
jgi:signal transduction histidine kinase